MRNNLFLFFLLSLQSTFAQQKTNDMLQKILSQNTNPALQKVLKEKDSFRLQIIYTQINRDENNVPSFKNYYFGTGSDVYFYPASTVKLPLSLLTLEKLNSLKIKGVNKYTALEFDSSHPWQIPVSTDSSSENNLPSLAHYIKKAFLISDNDAYNRMYQFVGQKEIHQRLWAKGYDNIRLPKQFMGLSLENNRFTNSVNFRDKMGNIIYSQPGAYNADSFSFGKKINVGIGYLNSKDSLINKPMDFSTSNNIPLEDLQQILQGVMFPSSVPSNKRFKLTADDHKFLYRYLSQYPSETDFPKYDTSHYYDSYVKFYFKDSSGKIPPFIRVFNKVGWAYGFMSDVSYVVDFKNKVEFMLTAAIYVNKDGILNDDKYDYESVGLPFMYELGQTIYRYELQRKRKSSPDLKAFKMEYKKQDKDYKKHAIQHADN